LLDFDFYFILIGFAFVSAFPSLVKADFVLVAWYAALPAAFISFDYYYLSLL
jgi:hypothetical protein